MRPRLRRRAAPFGCKRCAEARGTCRGPRSLEMFQAPMVRTPRPTWGRSGLPCAQTLYAVWVWRDCAIATPALDCATWGPPGAPNVFRNASNLETGTACHAGRVDGAPRHRSAPDTGLSCYSPNFPLDGLRLRHRAAARVAHRMAGRELYRWEIVSWDGKSVEASNWACPWWPAMLEEAPLYPVLVICAGFEPDRRYATAASNPGC